jgi:D-aminopeptidase
MTLAINKHKRDPIQPLVWPGPFRIEIRHNSTSEADACENRGWQRVDAKTVALQRDDYLDVPWA